MIYFELEQRRRSAERALHERIRPLANAIDGTPPGSLSTARIKSCLKLLERVKTAACRSPVPL